MALITRLYTFQNGTRANATEVNEEFDSILSLLNGNLDSYNLSDESISSTKLVSVLGTKIEVGTIPEDRLDFVVSHIDDTTSSISSLYSSAKIDEILTNFRKNEDSYTKLEIDADVQAIYDELATKANANNVYSRDNLDGKFELKADKETTYTKTEVDDALDFKMDLINAYNKQDIDGFLAGKADKTPTEEAISALNSSVSDLETSLSTKAESESVSELQNSVAGIDTILGTKQDKITQSPTAPVSPVTGDLWIDTSNTPKLLKRHNGVEFEVLGSASTSSDSGTGGGTTPVTINGVMSYKTIGEAPIPTELGQVAIIDGDIYQSGPDGASDNNLVPNMSGYTSGNITVSSSPVNSSSDVFYAFGTHETYPSRYFRTSSNANVYAMVDFGSPVDLGGLALTTRASDSYLTYYPKDFRIETSDDGVNWVTQKRYTGKTDWVSNTRYKFTLDNPVNARYIRIFVEITGGGNGFVAEKLEILEPSIAYLQHSESKEEIESTYTKKTDGLPLYPTKNDFPAPIASGSIAVDKQTGIVYISKAAPATPGVYTNDVSLIPKMTSNTLPSPYKAAASKELATNTGAFKAFDQTTDAQNVNNYFWTGNSRGTNVDWLSIGRTDGVKMLVNRIKITSSVAGANNYPKSATVEISDDAVNWNPIMEIADMGLTAGDQTYVINLPYAVETSYIRFNNFRAIGYSGGYGPVVKEIEIVNTNEFLWVETDFVRKINARTRIDATMSAAYTFTSNAQITIPYNTKGRDDNIEYDVTTYTATIKSAGLYHIDAQVWLNYLPEKVYAIAGYYINAIERRTAQTAGFLINPSSPYASPQILPIKETVWLSAGDKIKFYIQTDWVTGHTTSIANSLTTRMSINRLY